MTTERNSFLFGTGIGCIMGGTCIAVMAIVCFLLSFLAGSSGFNLDLDRSDETPTPTPTLAPPATATPVPTAAPVMVTSVGAPTETPSPAGPVQVTSAAPTETPSPNELLPPGALPAQVTSAAPTVTPLPMTTPASAGVIILTVNKPWEYVELQNIGSVAQDLTGWYIVSERSNARCQLSGTIEPGQLVRVWTMARDAEPGDATCNLNGEMWNDDEPDPAALYNAANQLVDREEV